MGRTLGFNQGEFCHPGDIWRRKPRCILGGFPDGSLVKDETQETWVQSLGREDPLEEEMAAHCSTLAWRIPWTEEPGGLQSMGSQSRTRLSAHAGTGFWLSQLHVCLEGKCHCYLLVRGQLFSRSVVSDSLLPRGLQHAGNAAQHPTGLRAGPRLRNTCPQMPAGYRLRNPGTELETSLI